MASWLGPHCWGGLASALSTVLMMTICSRLWAGEGGGRSCSTRAWRVSELMVCSWSGSKVTWSGVLMVGWVGSPLKSWMMVWVLAASVTASGSASVVAAADGAVALGLGVAGSGLGGSPSGMEAIPLFSCESLLWTKATGWLDARRTTAHKHKHKEVINQGNVLPTPVWASGLCTDP